MPGRLVALTGDEQTPFGLEGLDGRAGGGPEAAQLAAVDGAPRLGQALLDIGDGGARVTDEEGELVESDGIESCHPGRGAT